MKTRKNKNNLNAKAQLKEAASYIKESKNFIYFSIILFIVATIAGFLLSDHLTFLEEFLKELIEKTSGLNTFEMIFFILQNNLLSSLFSIFLGFFISLFPLASTVSNGAVMGYVLARTYEVAGFGVWWRLLPHGVFELPAIFISFGLGIKLGFNILKNYLAHYWKKSKIMILIPLGLALLQTIIGILGLTKMPEEINSIIPAELSFLIYIWVLVSSIFIYLTLFIIGALILDKKFSFAYKEAVRNFYQSINAFLMIIIPLLIIAAIIEGSLIIILG